MLLHGKHTAAPQDQEGTETQGGSNLIQREEGRVHISHTHYPTCFKLSPDYTYIPTQHGCYVSHCYTASLGTKDSVQIKSGYMFSADVNTLAVWDLRTLHTMDKHRGRQPAAFPARFM